ncbi:N-acetyltransferase [Acinetobacter sp. ANC 4558]|uniref:GNAT family N-acetyltransferase n=1 Tax=Acinetobacter sp. ANC 4558 TaxID=1977876 RepID=UPI000A34053B|nr:GNAT family N-acetyltransferase [Acinetobacter sp. ANC 4558]OTG87042.1 N-acetyltransferase [Acinetobacter sp. ANC 4558]
MYSFDFIEDIEKFKLYESRLISLLSKSIGDESILGFDENFEKNNQIEAYLEALRQNLKNKTLVIVVGIDRNDEEKIISTCQIKTSLQNTTKHIADLQKGIIDPHYRGSSLLKTTLNQIASYCLCKDIELLTLDVRENSPAHKIWLKCGFRVYGILEDYSRLNKEKFKGIYMAQSSRELFELTQPKLN